MNSSKAFSRHGTMASETEALVSRMKDLAAGAHASLSCGQMEVAIRQLVGIIELAKEHDGWRHQKVDADQQHGQAEATLQGCKILLEAGRTLNSLMSLSNALSAYDMILCIIKACPNIGDHEVDVVCSALTCSVQTYLYSRLVSQASDFVNCHLDFLSGLESYSKVPFTLGVCYMDLGLAQLENAKLSQAWNFLQLSHGCLAKVACFPGTRLEAKLLGSLAYCHLYHKSDEKQAFQLFAQARKIWKTLKWPLEELECILNTSKYYLEAQMKMKTEGKTDGTPDGEVIEDLKRLHKVVMKVKQTMQVADTFTYLGMVAFQTSNEKRAVCFFEQVLSLYKQAPAVEKNKEEITKLLRFIGVSSYNCRDFRRAAHAYLECFHMLESPNLLSGCKLSQIAECCASLGFTYSRLRDFDSMLYYYERALELETKLAPEDLELIETNIGSLYHVKAVKFAQGGDQQKAKEYYNKSEAAFNKALRYSWKSFPFVNFGYYLFCRAEYGRADGMLQQGYLNGLIDKDTVEFDHTEDPILIDNLKLELEGREDIRMPSTVLSLYLKVLCQGLMGNTVGAAHTAGQLKLEITSCRYEAYYTEGFGLDRMRGLCHSLLGYAFRSLSLNAQAVEAFKQALLVMPDYKVAKVNLKSCQQAIKR